MFSLVVICLKIRTFVVSATTLWFRFPCSNWLWFAWKFVPLWYQQQQKCGKHLSEYGCDLLENSYLCGISNNYMVIEFRVSNVVICLKIRTFVVSATTASSSALCVCALWFAWKFVPLWYQQQLPRRRCRMTCRCDLLENSYLCGISNNEHTYSLNGIAVVICLKIRTFVVSATTQF